MIILSFQLTAIAIAMAFYFKGISDMMFPKGQKNPAPGPGF
jgi:hypothetical protein